jgi:ribosome-binding factor A
MIEDGMYRVSLTRDGISATTYVSSMHLVEDKRKQLLSSIRKKAANAFS